MKPFNRKKSVSGETGECLLFNKNQTNYSYNYSKHNKNIILWNSITIIIPITEEDGNQVPNMVAENKMQ